MVHAKTLVPLGQIYCSLFDISKVFWLIVDLKNLGVDFTILCLVSVMMCSSFWNIFNITERNVFMWPLSLYCVPLRSIDQLNSFVLSERARISNKAKWRILCFPCRNMVTIKVNPNPLIPWVSTRYSVRNGRLEVIFYTINIFVCYFLFLISNKTFENEDFVKNYYKIYICKTPIITAVDCPGC